MSHDSSHGSYKSVHGYGVAEEKNGRFRRTMEDAHVFIDGFDNHAEQFFAAVYDGHGGRGAVDFTAEHFHENLLKELRTSSGFPDMPKIWKSTFLTTDAQMHEQGVLYAGSTAVVAYLYKSENGRYLFTANVGDARIVLSRGGKAHRLTYDHKGSDPEEARRIIEIGGFMNANRVNGILAVTRSLGDHTMKEFVIAEPYTFEVLLQEQDDILILACDGLWDVIGDQEAINLIKDEKDANKAARTLLDEALRLGTTDNVSVMVIHL
eukprot:TRINITY_DN15813_c0_g1_i1.p1 TRINITY_DN15813_c0_g1~~TRINITY_DN15813_c0_g1_i1.p1  ORF type:complete len:265 (-),score=54.64 TRINITY_DN15813_c0_g1_i1:237-1031(-)